MRECTALDNVTSRAAPGTSQISQVALAARQHVLGICTFAGGICTEI